MKDVTQIIAEIREAIDREGGSSIRGRFAKQYPNILALCDSHERLREALVAVLPLVAHQPKCAIARPTSEWAEFGPWNFDNCQCAIKQAREALKL